MVQNRWFIGVALPKELSETISQVQRELINEDTMQKPLVPHVTIIHPNPLMELSPLYFAPLAKKLTDSLLPCDIQLQSIGLLHSNVVYISVVSKQLQAIYDELVAALPHHIQAQYFVGKKFIAHVTVAQTRGRNSFDTAFVESVKKLIEPLLPTTFTVTNLTRFEWRASRNYIVKDL
jgi:2'-5' RNA ligase